MRSRLSGTLTKVRSENWRHGWQRSNTKGKGKDGVSTPDALKVIFTEPATWEDEEDWEEVEWAAWLMELEECVSN